MLRSITVSILIFYLSSSAFGAVCGPSFEAIDLNCILNQGDKFEAEKNKEKKRFESLKKLRQAKNIETKVIQKAEKSLGAIFGFGSADDLKGKMNNVYFYRTNAGSYGKFIIKSISKTKKSCSVYIESVTFKNKYNFEKSTTLVTKIEANSWNVDRASLDNVGGTDLFLRREHGLCILKKEGAQIFFARKIAVVDEVNDDIIIYYASLFLIALAVFLVARTIFQDEDQFKAQEKLEDAQEGDKKEVPNDIVLKYSRPFFKRYFTPVIQGMKNKRKIKDRYKRILASSGMTKYLTPEDFYAFKLFLIIGFPIVFLGLRAFLEETWPLIYVPAISIFGFFYPDIWIKGKIEERKKKIIESMPFVVDMLALSVEAGLDFVAAMQKVIEKAPNSPLVDEFEILIKETKIGSSRAEALRQMSWRVDSLPISSFCATLIAADSVGASIGPILKSLAQELREKRSAMIEKKGAEAATKILLPMIFLVLPAVLLIVAAPIALQLMGGE